MPYHCQKEQLKEKAEISKVPGIQNSNLRNDKTILVRTASANVSVNIDRDDIVNVSDSVICTDSGSESGKHYETGSAKHSQGFSNLSEPKLSRSLSDIHVCKKLREQYISRRQALQHNQQHTLAFYPNQRSVQKPRNVQKRHWRISFLGIASSLEEIFTQ